MKKVLKYTIITLLSLTVIGLAGFSVLFYKVKYGFPIYEKIPPNVSLDESKFNILVYSKTNGFSHTEAIEEGVKFFKNVGERNNWGVTFSNNGAIFNDSILNKFNLVIWNNVTGRTLNKDQRFSFKKFMENGGFYFGIHGAADDSHHWPWYYEKLIGADFSHHSLNPNIQKTIIKKNPLDTLSQLSIKNWEHSDEWYVFFDSPKKNNAEILYSIDGNSIITNGNMLWYNDKDFGMGENHPVIWFKCLNEKGTSIYSSLGHSKESMQNLNYQKTIEELIVMLEENKVLCNENRIP